MEKAAKRQYGVLHLRATLKPNSRRRKKMSKYLPNKYKRICIDFKLKDWNKIAKRYEICKMKPTAFIREMALRGEI
jgi:hypothetical protein